MRSTASETNTESAGSSGVGDTVPALVPAAIHIADIPHHNQAGPDYVSKLMDAVVIKSLPVILDVRIPLPGFRFRDLVQLATGRVLKTGWPLAEDLPVAAGDTRLFWAEFAVADQQLTVRVTRVA